MTRLTLRATYHRRVGPLLLALLLALLLSGSVAPENPASAQTDVAAAFVPQVSGRHFYLTKTNYATNQVLTACASGYHTASFWELYGVSNLIYDYNHPDAYTKADSGYGPPSYWYGWVRTGYDSSSSDTTGTGNCNNWSSVSNSVYGVSVRLSRTWETAPGDIGPWDATSFTCNYTGPVWCVGNFYLVYLPAVVRRFILYAPPCGPSNSYCETCNTSETAYGALKPSQAYQAYPNDNNDYYYFIVLSTASVTVRVTNYQGVGQLVLRKEDLSDIITDARTPEGDNTLEVTQNLPPGKYYVQVYTSESYSQSALYTLTVYQ